MLLSAKMSRSTISLFCSFLLLASSASAFNVTRILSQFPDYSNFNDLLSKCGIVNDINKRGTITLLAVPNGAIGDLTSKSDDVLKRVLATHVILDYYDIQKLQRLKDKTAKMTTMYQQSGIAEWDQGFMNVSFKDGSFVFGSAARGAPRDAKLEKSVMNQPFNISILGISQPIVTPGLDGTMAPVTAPPPSSPEKKSPPAAESPSDDDYEAESPEESAESPAESPEDSSSDDSDDTESPASAPSPDADDVPPADAVPPPPPTGSSAGKLKVSFGLFVVLASMVAAF